jgi:hypothetical protein
MKNFIKMIVLLAVTICFGTMVFAETPKAVKRENLVTKTAIVQAIDLPARVVTLQDKDGNVVQLKVDEKVKNLPQVKVGDQLAIKYYESMAIQLAKPGASPSTSKTQVNEAAKPGDKPAGYKANIVTVTTTIVAIDPQKTFVTFQGPEGNKVNVKVNDPKNLEKVKVGDAVEITYTQALAVDVTAVKVKKDKKK